MQDREGISPARAREPVRRTTMLSEPLDWVALEDRAKQAAKQWHAIGVLENGDRLEIVQGKTGVFGVRLSAWRGRYDTEAMYATIWDAWMAKQPGRWERKTLGPSRLTMSATYARTGGA